MSPIFSETAFQDKVVLITGAAGGIGSECARLFLTGGAHVILSDLDRDTLEQQNNDVDPSMVTIVPGNLTAAGPRAYLVQKIRELGGVDHVILAAGIYTEVAIKEMEPQQFDLTMDVNLRSVFQLVRELLLDIKDRGSIVTFSSVAGQRGSKHHAHYAASKAALVAFGRSLAWEVGERGIRVNAVAPGIIATNMTTDLVAKTGTNLLQNTPLQRFGEATEVAQAVTFLASDAASYITGATLDVNGGLHMS